MVRIALFADLHGNLPALRAVLDKVDKLSPDRIISLGDAIGIGPHPLECLELMQERGIEPILGNHEEYQTLHISPKTFPDGMAEGELRHQLWVHRQLTDEALEYMKSFPYQIQEEVEGLCCCFLHSPFSLIAGQFSHFTNLSKASPFAVSEAFSSYEVDFLGFGHSHLFWDWSNGKRYLNPGSLGCNKSGFARFSLLEIDKTRLDVFHFQVPYDKQAVLNDLIVRNVPEKQFIQNVFF
jgi:predicted phosphodiesterase